MKWLKSTTQKSYTFGGKTIPAFRTSDNSYLQLNDNEVEQLQQNAVINALFKAGAILVLDKEPATTDKTKLAANNAELRAQNAALNTELDETKKELDAYKKALEQKAANTSEEDVNTAVAAAKAETEQLRQEALDTIAAKDAEIEKLKADLEKAKAKKGTKE